MTQGEADERDRLEAVVGDTWDAINGCWRSLSDNSRVRHPVCNGGGEGSF